MLYEFLQSHRADIIARTRAKVAARPAPAATDAELSEGIPLFFGQLIDILGKVGPGNDAMTAGAAKQGDDMLRSGFTVGQVVHGYGDVCQAVTELAFETGAPITVDEFHTLNRSLDDAIASAVTEFGRLREQDLVDEGTERLGVLAHELRNRLNTALLAFAILKDGTVSINGSTGTLLERSLTGLAQLIDGALAEVRLESTVQRRETVTLAAFIEEVEIGAALEARLKSQQLILESVPPGVMIRIDRQLLGAAVANLLQNAFKFTPPHGHITLRTRATPDRVLIEVEDQCGGLAPGTAEVLFGPFTQRNTNRTGLGLGLTIARKAVLVHDGELRAENHPGKGCVFTVDLPRAPSGTVGAG